MAEEKYLKEVKKQKKKAKLGKQDDQSLSDDDDDDDDDEEEDDDDDDDSGEDDDDSGEDSDIDDRSISQGRKTTEAKKNDKPGSFEVVPQSTQGRPLRDYLCSLLLLSRYTQLKLFYTSFTVLRQI